MNEYAQWHAQSDGGRWAVSQDSQEVCRITADGVLQHWSKTYWFATKEWAELCARRLNAMDRAVRLRHIHSSLFISTPYSLGLNVGATTLNSGGREIFRLNNDGVIMHIDIPYLVWVWLRSTPLVSGLKRLWFGEASK